MAASEALREVNPDGGAEKWKEGRNSAVVGFPEAKAKEPGTGCWVLEKERE